MAKLSERRQAFVRAYIAGPPGVRGNGTRAAIAAGYSPRSANEQAAQLLAIPSVRAEIDRRLAKYDVTADRIIAELESIAFHETTDFVDWDADGVRLKPSADLEHAAPIAEVAESVSEAGRAVKIKFHDKLAALVHLAKIKGLMRDKVELSGADGVPLVFTIAPGITRRDDATP